MALLAHNSAILKAIWEDLADARRDCEDPVSAPRRWQDRRQLATVITRAFGKNRALGKSEPRQPLKPKARPGGRSKKRAQLKQPTREPGGTRSVDLVLSRLSPGDLLRSARNGPVVFPVARFFARLHSCSIARESVNSLKRSIYVGRVAAYQAKQHDEMQAVADALSLLANLVMAWNTMKMQLVLDRWNTRRSTDECTRTASRLEGNKLAATTMLKLQSTLPLSRQLYNYNLAAQSINSLIEAHNKQCPNNQVEPLPLQSTGPTPLP